MVARTDVEEGAMTAVAWLRRWMGSRPPESGWADDCPTGLPVPGASECEGCDSIPLTLLAPGQRGCVTCLQQPGGMAAAKLGALGVLPGTELEVVQQFPAFVLRMGFAEIALDETLAGSIRVRKL
jgi:Fe2+ transport system protein FeoA